MKKEKRERNTQKSVFSLWYKDLAIAARNALLIQLVIVTIDARADGIRDGVEFDRVKR